MTTKQVRPRSANAGDIYIGERIREARMAAGLSQSDLGEALNVTFQQIQKYEKGVNRIGGGRFETLAKTLDKPLTFFFRNGGDIRGEADPAMSRFIATKEGLELASKFYRISPHARGLVLDLVAHLAKEKA